jgi:hypothetical protein
MTRRADSPERQNKGERMNMDEKENIDRSRNDVFTTELLDAALTNYRSAAPRPGLEQRILANVRIRRQRALWVGWAWRLGAAAAVLAIAVAAYRLDSHHRPALTPPIGEIREPAAPEVVSAPLTATPLAPPRPSRRSRLRSRRPRNPSAGQEGRVASSEPRKDVFPTPRPVTEQEQLLVRFIQEAPKPVLLAVIEEEQGVRPLEIKELNVTPLNADKAADSRDH